MGLGKYRWISVAAVLCIGGCAPETREADAEAPRAGITRANPAAEAAPATAADSARERARVDAAAGPLRAAFEAVPVLGAREVAELRRDVNATQIATARRLGTRVPGEVEREQLLREGRLVELADSTRYWILRRMESSVPYVTPDAHAMLEEMGRRFHARLDLRGLPRYRMRITSVLRTDAEQSALRRTNPNASRIVSAHEFGTTVDVSHERFAVPAGAWLGGGDPRLAGMEVEMLEEVGREHSRVLQAELGRSISEMRGEGWLHVMMEDAQPVYHMTVARRLPAGVAASD
jgi:hypothetical protein